jgi:hypothetical protein
VFADQGDEAVMGGGGDRVVAGLEQVVDRCDNANIEILAGADVDDAAGPRLGLSGFAA